MLKWQLRGLQIEVKPGTFGIRYYSTKSTGLQSAVISGNKITYKKSSAQHCGLVVFFCKAIDISQSRIKQIIHVVAEKKIPFILCLQRDNEPAMLALDQMITAKEKLQDRLKATHWIIQKEISCRLYLFIIFYY